MMIDLVFPAVGVSVPADHSYPLYAALSRIVPQFHQHQSSIRFAPLTGLATDSGRLRLTPRSHLRVRASAEDIRTVLGLAGQSLNIAGSVVRLGAPRLCKLEPAPRVVSHLVTYKHAQSVDDFLTTTRARLAELGISGQPVVPTIRTGPRAGEPRRRVLRIRGAKIVGYALVVAGLTTDDSVRLQELGLGGRQHLGCGFFLPQEEPQ
ncbi:MAG: type I-MYXAN CRISPR-associated protein Cas6/Cmx6 [Gemmataceae bacterium]|nr:type I-MYXAN CRISPR-associated protein Cas6/Cmx6 [Gemmataceae bacterium]